MDAERKKEIIEACGQFVGHALERSGALAGKIATDTASATLVFGQMFAATIEDAGEGVVNAGEF